MKTGSIILLLLGAFAAVTVWQQHNRADLPQPLQQVQEQAGRVLPHTPETPSPKLVQSARSQIGQTVRYDPAYEKLAYPMGDVPRERGVCTDVVIRALREQKKNGFAATGASRHEAAFFRLSETLGLEQARH